MTARASERARGREGGSDAALLETGEGCDPADGAVCREEGSDCEECG